ncbi:MAG: leucine-rich repeat domain-containing protein [Planctomycetia bacterium]
MKTPLFWPQLAVVLAGWCMTLATGDVATAGPSEAADVAAAKARLAALGNDATSKLDADGHLTEITIEDGAELTDDDVALFGRLGDLRSLRILNCRALNDAMVGQLTGLENLDTLALTNSAITDAGVETLAQAFPNLVELDLSSNTNLTGAALKQIAGLAKLERLTLLQNRFNDLNTRRLGKMPQLRSLDLRGNMEAGDMTLEVVGRLPRLTALKHRSTAVTDTGLEGLAASPSLESLLMQDFVITNASGPHLAKLAKLSSLEVFRCQGFGTEGVLALAGLPLTRLTLRDLPDVGDAALGVLGKLPRLKRLYLHELASLGDEGLRQLAAAKELEVLDIWSLPRMTDATVQVIAGLPNLKELSIRETGVTEASAAAIAGMPKLQSLTFKNNGPLSAEQAAKLKSRKWTKLDLGGSGK